MGIKKPMSYKGKVYGSRQELADAFNLSPNAVDYRLRHNIPLEAPLIKNGGKFSDQNKPKNQNGHPWRTFQVGFIGKGEPSEDQQKILESTNGVL